jgi:cytochrome c oxidase subunit 1
MARPAAPASVAVFWSAFGPLVKGLLWGGIGFGVGAGLMAGVRAAVGLKAWAMEPLLVVGYVFGLVGWLLGVGMWDVWVREWFGLPVKADVPRDWRRYFRFCTDHKVIGVQYLVTFTVVLLLGGLLGLLMRLELMAPGRTVMGPDVYNQIMSLHGILLIALAVVLIIGGFGNFVLPLQIGAGEVAFPRVNALSYWIVPPVAVLLLTSPLMGGFDTGWTAYPSLALVNASGQVPFLLAFITIGLSSILGGLNFLTTVITLRARGMTWSRIPIFTWSVFAASMIALTATQFVAFALLMVLLDRVAGTSFFKATFGGKPLLYQHIFWFYSHPAVYIMILPAFGIILEIVSPFARKPLFAYRWVVTAFLAIVGISFIVWAHHLYTSGMSPALHIPFMVTTEIISIPTGAVFLAGLGTLWLGHLRMATPLLFALGYFFNFLIGGITGIFLADVPTDIHLQDTYFVVGHFHYTMMGAQIFAFLAAVYYWFPKITGRMLSERLGRLHFWWLLITYNLTFLPMFWAGVHGMTRRTADYPAELAGVNMYITVMAFLLAASFVVFVVNVVYSWVRGKVATDNPWDARTLEWATSSPPPPGNFRGVPVVVGGPYDYGVPGAPRHAVIGVAGGAEDTPRPAA